MKRSVLVSDGVTYRLADVDDLGTWLAEKLRREWGAMPGRWTEGDRSVLDLVRSMTWKCKRVSIIKFVLDRRTIDEVLFRRTLARRLAHQVNVILKGGPIWPPVMSEDGVAFDGYHRVMALRALGKLEMAAYVGEWP